MIKLGRRDEEDIILPRPAIRKADIDRLYAVMALYQTKECHLARLDMSPPSQRLEGGTVDYLTPCILCMPQFYSWVEPYL